MKLRRALFLDRDGVVNVDYGYVGTIDRFEWQEGIFDLLAAARDIGLITVIVTNQSGIGRGLFSEPQFLELTRWMCGELEAHGTPIAGVYHCPFHPNAVRQEYRIAEHPWRKPNPGMLIAAVRDFDIDAAESVLIGDKRTDMQAGAAAGVGTLILVGDAIEVDSSSSPRFLRMSDLKQASQWLRNWGSRNSYA